MEHFLGITGSMKDNVGHRTSTKRLLFKVEYSVLTLIFVIGTYCSKEQHTAFVIALS